MYYKSHVTAISRAENGDLSSVGGRKWCKSTQVWGPSELVDLV